MCLEIQSAPQSAGQSTNSLIRSLHFLQPFQTHEKRYPRISNEWNDTPQEQMPSTKRLVNQMNIANETKITLYKKKKDKAKKPTAKQKTSG